MNPKYLNHSRESTNKVHVVTEIIVKFQTVLDYGNHNPKWLIPVSPYKRLDTS